VIEGGWMTPVFFPLLPCHVEQMRDILFFNQVQPGLVGSTVYLFCRQPSQKDLAEQGGSRFRVLVSTAIFPFFVIAQLDWAIQLSSFCHCPKTYISRPDPATSC
jgi:hypothetical protein